jgi:hypothetical protein
MFSFAIEIALCLAAGLGQFVLCVALVNRIHSLAIPRPVIGVLSACCWLTLLLAPLALFHGDRGSALRVVMEGDWLPLLYLIPGWSIAAIGVVVCVRDATGDGEDPGVLETRETAIDMIEAIGGSPARGRLNRLISHLPGNQALRLHVSEKTLQVPRMRRGLDGLSIAHLTDLHMSGRIGRAYFEQVVELTNAAQPDLVVITGDLFDSDDCFDWIDRTLARLKAPAGVYFVLGNHDLRVDSALERKLLAEAGLIDLGGRWTQIDIRGQAVLLAGNELPWFSPAADMENCPEETGEIHRLRILLSHSPDQFEWARRFEFDLMLAGHNHGGQIRFPLVGPIVAPSRFGTRHASGTFYSDPTVMHVSRGISSLTQLRWNCPPELALLTLRSGLPAMPEGAGELSLSRSEA